jgi:hypothetical protein
MAPAFAGHAKTRRKQLFAARFVLPGGCFYTKLREKE